MPRLPSAPPGPRWPPRRHARSRAGCRSTPRPKRRQGGCVRARPSQSVLRPGAADRPRACGPWTRSTAPRPGPLPAPTSRVHGPARQPAPGGRRWRGAASRPSPPGERRPRRQWLRRPAVQPRHGPTAPSPTAAACASRFRPPPACGPPSRPAVRAGPAGTAGAAAGGWCSAARAGHWPARPSPCSLQQSLQPPQPIAPGWP